MATTVKVPPAGPVSNYAEVVLSGAKAGPVYLGITIAEGTHALL